MQQELNKTEAQLWRDYQAEKTTEARNALVQHYLGYVITLAVKYFKRLPKRSNMTVDDLVSFGVMGLIDILDRFNPDLGTKFLSFASLRIFGAIIDGLREFDHNTRHSYKNGTAKEIHNLTANLWNGESCRRDYDNTIELLAPEARDTDIVELRDEVESKLASLSPTERTIFIQYNAHGLRMKDIGELVGLSESRVSQIHTDILKRLRKKWCHHELDPQSRRDRREREAAETAA